MADTGENRQISGRANAKEAQSVRASKKMVSVERSTEKTSNAVLRGSGKAPDTARKIADQHRPLVVKHDADK